MRVKDWEKFQHYKDRAPPWIKLYRGLLDDPDWHDLDGDAAKALVMIWLIASEADGELPEPRKLAFRLRISETKTKQILTKLSHWLEHDASTPLAERNTETETETETERERETETETEAESPLPRRARASERGERLPADWLPSDSDLAFAAAILPPARIPHERDKFRDYWHAANGPPSVKRDWAAAWRNWCRKAVEMGGGRKTNGKHDATENFRERAERLIESGISFGTRPTLDAGNVTGVGDAGRIAARRSG